MNKISGDIIMKKIVVYKSISGFTKKYAGWIAQELQSDIFNIKDTNIKKLQDYDLIVFGGSLHAAGISGIGMIKNNLKKLSGKKIVVFATGASPLRENMLSEVLDHNFSKEDQEKIRFYYFRGGFDFNKLNLTNKILMILFKWIIKSKKEKTDDENEMLSAYSKPLDFTKKDYIKELIEYANSFE